MGRLAWLLLAGLLGCGVPAPPDPAALAEAARGGDGAAVEQLLGLLGRDAPAEQRAAVYRTLLEVPAAGAAAILRACDDPDPVRREHALALAGNLKPPGAGEAARRALADGAFSRRYAAAWALGELGEPDAAGDLVAALSQEDALVAREAARALVKIGRPAVPAVLDALPRLDPAAAGYALRVLGEVGDPAARQALVAALEHPATRADAAWALGKLGDPAAGPELLARLADPEWRVRLELSRALGLLEFAPADPDLDRLRASDPVPAVREWAARSLALLRGTPQTFRDARGEERVPDSLYR